MLGELYKPRGLALETAQAVLETKEVMACNVAWGCPNGCLYCYVPKLTRQKRTDAVRYPVSPPVNLVRKQLEKMSPTQYPKGVFLSFCTDPFLPKVKQSTEDLISFLLDYGIDVATCSKLDASYYYSRHGMTIVSLESQFYNMFEPNALSPLARLKILEICKSEWGEFVWVSMEPYPPSAIYKQNLTNLLNELNFVDLIIFGMWNYDSRARTEEAKREYADNINVITDFCKSNNIRLHIKSDTLRFVENV